MFVLPLLPKFQVQAGLRWRGCLLATSLLACVLLAAACLSPASTPVVMPESPLIPGANTALVENRFRVVEIIRHGEPVTFDAIQPVFVTFGIQGELGLQTTNCNAWAYFIIAENERKYRLIPGAGTAQGCGEPIESQESWISEAITATTEYELKGSQLILRGDDVHIVLEIDNSE